MYHTVNIGHKTRFNPTTNGELHLGHVYIALFNATEAHTNGDEFIVRFEDNQPEWLAIYGIERSCDFAARMLDNLDWLGIRYDGYTLQSEMLEQVYTFASSKNAAVPAYTWPHPFPLDPTKSDRVPPMLGDWYSYTPFFTFCKVVLDNLQNIGALIRGDDLRSEFALYMHYCDMLGLSRPMHYYMPRLQENDGSGLAKQYGAKSITEYRKAGVKPGDILDLLAKSSLKDPDRGWFLGNVKRKPRLVKDFEKLSK